MEVFVDAGLFEMVAALALGAVVRRLFAVRAAAFGCLVASLVAPAALVYVASAPLGRWLAVVCLATSLVNVTALFSLLRRYDVGALLARER